MRPPNMTHAMKDLCKNDIKRFTEKTASLTAKLQEVNLVMDDRYLDLTCPPDVPFTHQDTSSLQKLALKFTDPERVIRTAVTNATNMRLSHR